MQLKTILNHVQKFKSFVYGAVRCVEDASRPALEAELHPRANSHPSLSLPTDSAQEPEKQCINK